MFNIQHSCSIGYIDAHPESDSIGHYYYMDLLHYLDNCNNNPKRDTMHEFGLTILNLHHIMPGNIPQEVILG